MKKDKISEEQKKKAIDLASQLGANATEEEIRDAEKKVDKFQNNKILSSLWDNILLLKALIKSPYVQGSLLSLAIGSILYLVLPIDVVPDFLPLIGLLDDVAVILALFPLVINGIKKDPAKALKVYDTLPKEVKKLAAKVLGIAGGAYVGYKVGSVVGDKVQDLELNEEYCKLVGGPLPLDEGINKIKGEMIKKGEELICTKVKGQINKLFEKKYRRSLELVTLFLLSIIFSLSPYKAGIYIASGLLVIAYGSVAYSIIRNCIKAYPYIKNMLKTKSIYKGVEISLKEQFVLIAQADMLLSKLNIELGEEDLKSLVKYFLKAFRKQIVWLVVGLCIITLGFWLFKAILAQTYLSKSIFEILLYPFFALTV